jgi:hypothetical protein
VRPQGEEIPREFQHPIAKVPGTFDRLRSRAVPGLRGGEEGLRAADRAGEVDVVAE